MKQEFREIIENEFDCLLHDVDFVIKKEGTLQSVINCMNQVKNNGVLGDVSKQRELLIAYTEYLAQQDITTSTYWLEVYNVDAFLKSNL